MHNEKLIDLGDHPKLWEADRKNESLIGAFAEAYREAIVGMSLEDLRIPEFVDQITADRSNFYSTIDRLEALHGEGYQIHLISGSPGYIVDEFAGRFGFRSAGSLYRRTGGRFNGKCRLMATAAAKAEYIAKFDSRRQRTHTIAFGDTASDAPLFASADYSVLVSPNDKTEAAIGSLADEILREG
jgi:phosphoserine phosphatase